MVNLRPIIPTNPIEIVRSVTGVSESLGEFVAGPTPANPVGAAIQQRYRDACDSWSNGLQWTTALSPSGRVHMENLCDPWLTSQGSGGPQLQPPEVTGGQCPGVEYFAGAPDVTTPSVSQGIGPLSVSTSSGTQDGRPTFTITFNWGGGLTGGVGSTTSFDDGPSPTISERYSGVTTERVDGQADTCGDSPSEIGPNPNPRPNPNLPSSEEPFTAPDGRPVVPMPPITDPFGEPVQLPNFPMPPLFGDEGEPGDSPNVGPPVSNGPEIDGSGNQGGDDDFGEPPEGHIWVGFVVRLSDQGLTEGLQVNSLPEPIYRSSTGNYRAKYDIEGTTVYSSPYRIEQQTSTYWLDLPGLTLTGSRVNVPSNDSYTVTPLSQPKTDSEEPQQV